MQYHACTICPIDMNDTLKLCSLCRLIDDMNELNYMNIHNIGYNVPVICLLCIFQPFKVILVCGLEGVQPENCFLQYVYELDKSRS